MLNNTVIVCMLFAFVHDLGCDASVLHYPVPLNLTCFLCNTVDQDGESCVDLSPNRTNSYYHECMPEETFCTLVRVKYIKDGSQKSVVWSVERNCTKDCLNGCITMGERTKLNVCRHCCKDNLCNMNTDRGVDSVTPSFTLLGLIVTMRFIRLL